MSDHTRWERFLDSLSALTYPAVIWRITWVTLSLVALALIVASDLGYGCTLTRPA